MVALRCTRRCLAGRVVYGLVFGGVCDLSHEDGGVGLGVVDREEEGAICAYFVDFGWVHGRAGHTDDGACGCGGFCAFFIDVDVDFVNDIGDGV